MSLDREDDIQVSVCVVTYNQEKYIAECLESLVTQQTTFKFEIIVGEDCSTDNTRKIVQQYVEQYPDLIVPLFYEENVGAVENVKRVYKAAKGKYIAHMDGDDMALPTKLQKQFDILEGNLDCNVCSHNMVEVYLDEILKSKTWVYPTGKYNLLQFYQKMPIFSHSSKMFRNKYKKTFWDDAFKNDNVLDIDIHILNLEDGDLYNLNEFLGKYRVASGVSQRNNKYNPNIPIGVVRCYEKGMILFKDNSDSIEVIRKSYALAMIKCAYNYAIHDKDVYNFREYVFKSFKIGFFSFHQLVFGFFVFFPKVFFKSVEIRNKYKFKRLN